MNRNFGTRSIQVCALAAMAVLMAACSGKDGVAGGASGDMGIVAKDIAGEAQKGPFVKGSAVTVQGIDCKTLELSDEIFEGKVKSDKGDFAFDDVTLSASSCALFEVTGKYRDELTGKNSAGEITLHALTDLKDRKNVNVNVLTELEYERVVYLVTEKGKTFADAKARAEKEVLAAFGIAGDFGNSEDLTIYESGDGNAALLAVSVLMLAKTDDAGLAKRIEKFADLFAETGKWDDGKTKATIEEWQVVATADGTLDSIRKNVEGWGYADVVPAFEKYVEVFGDTVILSSDSHQSSSSTPVEDLSSSSAKAGSEYDATANTLKDLRDGKVYNTVTIGNQIWMAENLNFETDSSFCYNDSAEYCAKYGRLYVWTAAMDACPSDWHLPDLAEWRMLLAAVGGDSIAGTKLKSTSGWNSDGNGTDDFGFTVLPAGGWGSKDFVGEAAAFWTSEWYDEYDDYAYGIRLYTDTIVRKFYSNKYIGSSVRCVKGSATAPKSSSSSAGEVNCSALLEEERKNGAWNWNVPKECRFNPDIDYGTMTDERDGKVYRTVKIGNQVWMAENLNYYDSTNLNIKEASWCYGKSDNKDSSTCDVTGRLYTWAAAITVCPSDWRLPSDADWDSLFSVVGGRSGGRNLKSLTGWYGDGGGTDSFGFSAIPGGHKYDGGAFFSVGIYAYFWSSTEREDGKVRGMSLYYSYDDMTPYIIDKNVAYSVRCVRD